MHPTTTPRRSERTRRERGAATAAGFARLRAARLAKLEKNKNAGAKAQQQKQQSHKSDPTQHKVLAEVHREAGRLILTIKGVKFTKEKEEEKSPNKDVNAEGGPDAPAASLSGRSDKTEKDPAATTNKGPGAAATASAATSDRKRASGEHELPPLPRGVARCFVKGAAAKRKRAATASDDCPRKRAAATKKAVRRLVKD
jgi:hypothetical protein